MSDRASIAVGDIYEDCAYHPCLCTNVHSDGSISGISLIDATSPRTCDLANCGVVPLDVSAVLEARQNFPAYIDKRKREAD